MLRRNKKRREGMGRKARGRVRGNKRYQRLKKTRAIGGKGRGRQERRWQERKRRECEGKKKSLENLRHMYTQTVRRQPTARRNTASTSSRDDRRKKPLTGTQQPHS